MLHSLFLLTSDRSRVLNLCLSFHSLAFGFPFLNDRPYNRRLEYVPLARTTQKSVSMKRLVNPSSPVSSSTTQNLCSPSSVSPSSMMKKEDRFWCAMFGSATPVLETQNGSRKSCFTCKHVYCDMAICRMFIDETKNVHVVVHSGLIVAKE